MKKRILFLLFTNSLSLLQAQVPSDSLNGVYAGKFWYMNNSPWVITNDTLYMTNIDSSNCSHLGYFKDSTIYFVSTAKYFTDYFSCNTPPPTNFFMKFYSLDSVKWIANNQPQPAPNFNTISQRFYGKRIGPYHSTTSIKHFFSDELLSFYPNPVNKILNVEKSDFNKNEEITIFDILGNEVLKSKEKQIDISTLPNGMYYIHSQTICNFVNKKIIVQH
ncbi:MAG: T9SS type A sorting domain-containing protein [Bacteroidetes bacterium]|nr:T9SS type A sorting domain-containing protein [Bacteroidota bacterium]